MTTFDLFRRASIPAAAVALLSLAACSGTPDPVAAPTATVTVTETAATGAPAPADSPAAGTPDASETPGAPAGNGVADPTADDSRPPISAANPPVFGGVFQSDPGHDFTKGISPSRDGVVRAQLRTMTDANVVEYVPVKWVKEVGGSTAGHFEGPPEGDGLAFAAPIAKGVVFLSAVGCDGKDQTINSSYVGTQRCSRDKLISRADKGDMYALVTVQGRQIVKVVEIYAA
ncbi:hypothetical protein JOL79_07715 [Microbispora sp. RL4-1S]|uniref:Uncharacterized protein n=1 Tax=Microbispora oryzae TaxID=2806554 RepID=A0A940WI68_9ACTN|nr:hypothetical protein [Microbispora oryzae]MBP2703687.1 hypothetical protein [Microbispora oryzae]